MPLRFHLLTKDPAAEGIVKLGRLARHLGIALEIHSVNMTSVEGLPTYHYNEFCYLRILAPRLLPDAGELLYLDSDMLVRSSLHELFGHQPQASLSAVREYGCVDLAHGFSYLQFSAGEAAGPYFNSGLLLIHVPGWNAEKLSEKMLDFLHHHKSALHNGDQDAVNGVMRGDIRELDYSWNFQIDALHWFDSKGWPPEREELLRRRSDLEANAKVAHFIGKLKPWEVYLHSPYAAEYRRGLCVSGWLRGTGAFRRQTGWLFAGIKDWLRVLKSRIALRQPPFLPR